MDLLLALTLDLHVLTLVVIESGVLVEEIGDEGEVELGVAHDDVLGINKLAAADLLGVLEHQLCALQGIGLAQRLEGTDPGHELVEENGVALRVLDVAGEVLHLAGAARALEVKVKPAQEVLLGRDKGERLEILGGGHEGHHLGVLLERHLVEEVHADDLPQQAENEVSRLGACAQVASSNVDH